VKRFALVMFALAALLLVRPGLLAAQEATPSPGGILGFPDPAECTVAARTIPELEAILATPAAAAPEASPTAITEMPAGAPVDATTTAEIQAVLREAVACINTGDILKIIQFYSDDLIRRLLGNISIEQIEQQGTPTPLTQEQMTELIAVSGMVMLPDGRVAVVVTGDDHSNPAPASDTLFLFVNVDGRWLIDDFLTDVDIATPAP
jgi:hypothetical protein